ncbi:hypothetical protein F0U62_07650 [Cystobacter fuscus]|uniref:hypothetical protein n=1 Tax=Cystobacter fuscus TaxID=43 RepID=UPI002B29EDD1|nr:hypothetical protein F0U62_07650 [Cystobacter fuscus]
MPITPPGFRVGGDVLFGKATSAAARSHGGSCPARGGLLRGAEWTIPQDSPLASLGLAGARPWVSFQARDFEWTLPAAVPVD